jgi:hypothetical protein
LFHERDAERREGRPARQESGAGFVLDVTIAAALAVAIHVALYGGFQLGIGPVRLSARSLTRPLIVCTLLAAGRVMFLRRSGGGIVPAIGRVGFLALFGVLAGTWFRFAVTSCGGADSYGYVSASRLLRSFQLSYLDPIADLPLSDPVSAVTPLGYVAAPDRHTVVPGYPLGLPAVMAAFAGWFGNGAEFYVSPVLATCSAAVAYRIARVFTDAAGASLSAMLVAAAPIFVNQAIQPMSDVAATFWLLLGVWLLIRRDGGATATHVAAGAAAGMAFVTRPALAIAAGALALAALALRGRRTAMLFVAAFAPFAIVQALLHWHLYGGVLQSGYGTAAQIFTIQRLPANVASYVGWLNYSASPVFLPTVLAGAFACGAVRWWAAGVGVFAAVMAPYLFYFTYDNWQDTRFLLPGLAVVLIGCGITIRNLVARWMPRALVPLALVAIAYVAAAASHRFLDRHHAFALARIEAKYSRVGESIVRSAPPRTAVFAFLHSGSVRFYAGRPTVRWDRLSSHEIAAAVDALHARGWESWAVVDGPEEGAAFWPKVSEVDRQLLVEPRERVAGVDVVVLRPRADRTSSNE